MSTILQPGYLRWDGFKFVLDPSIEIVGPAGPPGPDGPPGPPGPGSGGSTVYSQGTPIANNPHTGLNFIGPGVSVADAGFGIATININGNLIGDVTGTTAANTVTKIQGTAVSATTPTIGQILTFNGTNYVPTFSPDIPVFFSNLSTTAPLTTRQSVTIDGFSAVHDGGEGQFIWNSTDVRAADGGTIAAVTGIGTGRWNRVFFGAFNAKWFGAKGDGTTNDTTAINSAEAAVVATGGGTLFFPVGTYNVTSLTLTSLVKFDGGALLSPSGSVTFSGGIDAGETQQIFAAGAVINFSTAKPSVEMWVHWWGAKGNESTDDTAALQAALLSYQNVAQQRFGSALKFAAGGYIVSSTLVLNNCALGGLIQGQGIQGTFIFGTAALAGKVVLDLVNCTQVLVEKLAVQCSSGPNRTLTVAAAGGTLTLSLNSTIPGLVNGMTVVVARVNAIGNDLCGFETAVVLSGAPTTTLTLVSALVGSYAISDIVYLPTFAGIRIHEDSLTGISSNNRLTEVFAGRGGGLLTNVYALAIDYNTAGSDVNNPNHYITNCDFEGGAEAAVLIYGNNAENLTFNNTLFVGSWGVKTQNAASFSLINPGFAVTKGDILFGAGGAGSQQQEDKITIVGGYSEGAGQFAVMQDTGYSFFDMSVFGFSRKGLTGTSSITSTISSGTTAITVTGGGFAQGFYPGQAVDIWSFDNTVHETNTIDYVLDNTHLVLKTPLANTYTKGINAYTLVILTRTIDITANLVSMTVSSTFLGFGGFAGILLAAKDTGGSGVFTMDGCRVGACGYVMDGLAFQDRGSFWQTANDGVRKVTLLNGATENVLGQKSNFGTAFVPGSWRGVTDLFSGESVPLTIDNTMEIPLLMGTARVNHANSPYTSLIANICIVVDCSTGNVIINLPVLSVGQFIEIKHDETTSIDGYTITVNAGAGQTLSQYPVASDVFASSYIISGIESSGVKLVWANKGSGSGKLLINNSSQQNNYVFNVKWFGAKGDGTTDDTVAIQNTINAAILGHGTVYLPGGNYKVMSEINVLPNVFGFYGLNIVGEGFADGGQGAGGDRTTIFAGTSMRSVINMARTGVACRDFKVDGNHFATYAVYCQGISISTFTNIMTINAKIDGWHLATNYDNNPSLSPTFDGGHCINDQSKWYNCWGEANGNVYATANIVAQYANLGIPHTTAAGTVATTSGSDLLTFTSAADLTTLNIRVGDVVRIGPALSDTSFSTTSSTAVSAGTHTITVGSTTGAFPGQYIGIDTGGSFEVVEVQSASFSPTTLTAIFTKSHSGTYTVFANITQFYQICVVSSNTLRVLGSGVTEWPTTNASGLDFAICVGNGYHEEQSGDNNVASIVGGYWDQNACFGLMFAGLFGPHVTHGPQCQLNGVAGIGLGFGPNVAASIAGQEVLGSKFDRPYFEANIGGDMFIGQAAGFEILQPTQQASPSFGIAHDLILSFGYASFAFPNGKVSSKFSGMLNGLQGSLYQVGFWVNRIPTTVLTNGQLQGQTGLVEAQPTVNSNGFQFGAGSFAQSVQAFTTDGYDHTLTSTPTIAIPATANVDIGSPQGVIIILTNNGTNTVTLQRHDTLPGSKLQLETSTLDIAPLQSVTLMYLASASFWRQISKLVMAS